MRLAMHARRARESPGCRHVHYGTDSLVGWLALLLAFFLTDMPYEEPDEESTHADDEQDDDGTEPEIGPVGDQGNELVHERASGWIANAEG